MNFPVTLLQETKKRNFYIYSQWFLALTALLSIASFLTSLVHFPTLLHQQRWLGASYVVIVQLFTSVMTSLFVSPFLNIDGDNLLQYDYRMFFWLAGHHQQIGRRGWTRTNELVCFGTRQIV
ncbi:hypothetical protein K505DRAFT_33168 [Melanomma pulvis-pyrius CBS 109.77]|uniref:Uncharacterized protein n=1 Tax=Melanomma pulvis-pyrius CBS 109.77 TaxID=1314802 RepID=A0A6A6XE69_9PLEO|nr:hypothetical protein K505DRAFT_33168 [Melanomma pulvis-pyrius CBS 109.77]